MTNRKRLASDSWQAGLLLRRSVFTSSNFTWGFCLDFFSQHAYALLANWSSVSFLCNCPDVLAVSWMREASSGNELKISEDKMSHESPCITASWKVESWRWSFSMLKCPKVQNRSSLCLHSATNKRNTKLVWVALGWQISQSLLAPPGACLAKTGPISG